MRAGQICLCSVRLICPAVNGWSVIPQTLALLVQLLHKSEFDAELVMLPQCQHGSLFGLGAILHGGHRVDVPEAEMKACEQFKHEIVRPVCTRQLMHSVEVPLAEMNDFVQAEHTTDLLLVAVRQLGHRVEVPLAEKKSTLHFWQLVFGTTLFIWPI